MTTPDPYRCPEPACGKWWPVRSLAAECCTPERLKRLAKETR